MLRTHGLQKSSELEGNPCRRTDLKMIQETLGHASLATTTVSLSNWLRKPRRRSYKSTLCKTGQDGVYELG